MKYKGLGITYEDLGKITGRSPNAVRMALRRGRTVKEIKAKAPNKKRVITYDGRTQSIDAWAEETGINMACLRARIYDLHWPVEKALTTPVRKGPKVKYQGKTMTIIELADTCGIEKNTLYNRIAINGMDPEKAVSLGRTRHRTYKYKEKEYTLQELSKECKIDASVFYDRIKHGWSVEDAVERPVQNVPRRGSGAKKYMRKPKKYKYMGQKLTIPELSKISGISVPTLRYRIGKKGMTAEEAIRVPIQKMKGV